MFMREEVNLAMAYEHGQQEALKHVYKHNLDLDVEK